MNTTVANIFAALLIVRQHWLSLGAAPDEAIEPILSGLATAYNLPLSVIRVAYDIDQTLDCSLQG
jgi:hypothetical protein